MLYLYRKVCDEIVIDLVQIGSFDRLKDFCTLMLPVLTPKQQREAVRLVEGTEDVGKLQEILNNGTQEDLKKLTLWTYSVLTNSQKTQVVNAFMIKDSFDIQ